MRTLTLTKGQSAIVDDADFERLSQYPWCYHNKGYATSRAGLLHRIILNAPKGMQVDHINGDKLDNRRENLRLVSAFLNQQNRHRPNRNSKSGELGVHWYAPLAKWQAQVMQFGKKTHLGYFNDKSAAIEARSNAAATL